jgi:ribonuclease HI
MMNFDVEIWTDGACVSNGKPNARAAWAFVSGKNEKSGLVKGPKQTNNVAEGLAIFYALEWAAENNYKKIKIYTDSQISIYNVKKSAHLVKVNREIFQSIEDLIVQNGLQVSYEKVLGHSDDVNNSRADMLANNLAAGR